MKIYSVILFLLFLTIVLSLKYEQLSLNKPNILKSFDESIHFYKISLKELKVAPNEIKIDSKIMESKNSSSAIIGIYYEPFHKENYNKIFKSNLGNPIILDNKFIYSAMNKEQNIYFAIYCQKCIYHLNIIPSDEINSIKNFVQIPTLRMLDESNIKTNNDTITRMNFYCANGISGLIVAFFMIFISVIASIIMMNIYVHNTALVEQPLKLGRIES